VIRKAVEVTEFAKDHGLIVELSGEDASRADQDYLTSLYMAGIDAGADRLASAILWRAGSGGDR
jgi:D-citramalate synthase